MKPLLGHPRPMAVYVPLMIHDHLRKPGDTPARSSSSRVSGERCRVGRSRVSMAFPVVAGLVLLAGAFTPIMASAGMPRVLTSHAASTGPVEVDAGGNGYVAWVSSASGNPLYFCKIPKGKTCTHALLLPIPTGATWDNYRVNQPFPVIGGKPGVVSIVAPSYDFSNVVVWTSTNGGASFGEPQVIQNSHYDGTGTDDVLRSPDADAPYYPDEFAIASSNPGLFFTFTGIGAIGALEPPFGFEQNTTGVAGGVTNATLGFGQSVDPGPTQETQTVEAFSTDAAKPQLDFFWAPVPGVSGGPGSLEHGPINVGVGTNPRLAGGPGGLFLLSEDYQADLTKPLRLDVRKWNPQSETFSPPTLVASIPNDVGTTAEGGLAQDLSTGVLTVAWPMQTANGGTVMDIWTSANGAKSFSHATKVGAVGYAFEGPVRLASVGNSGFLTWQDSTGLHLVDLSHL